MKKRIFVIPVANDMCSDAISIIILEDYIPIWADKFNKVFKMVLNRLGIVVSCTLLVQDDHRTQSMLEQYCKHNYKTTRFLQEVIVML